MLDSTENTPVSCRDFPHKSNCFTWRYKIALGTSVETEERIYSLDFSSSSPVALLLLLIKQQEISNILYSQFSKPSVTDSVIELNEDKIINYATSYNVFLCSIMTGFHALENLKSISFLEVGRDKPWISERKEVHETCIKCINLKRRSKRR